MNRTSLAAIVATLAACIHPAAPTARAVAAIEAPATCAGRNLGAIGDGVTDDRAAIQAKLDACPGHEVYLPAGSYLVSAAPLRNYALHVSAGTTLRGDGQGVTTLLLAPGAPLSTQLLWIEDAPDVTLQALTLDGQRSGQSAANTAGPQRHGAFVKHSPRFSARAVTSQHNAGDGLYLYSGSDHAVLSGLSAVDNDRDGVTLGGAVSGVVAVGSTFARNGQDGWHSEGSGNNNDVSLVGDIFDGNAGFALTASGVGADPSVHNYRWTITDSEVNGPVAIVWADDVLYARNHGTNASGLSSVTVYRTSARVRIEDNTLSATGAVTADSITVINVMGTGVGQAPSDVTIARNTITTLHPQFGISVVCATGVTVVDNIVTGSAEGVGPHSSGIAGIYVRATRVEVPMVVAVSGNTVTQFGMYGLMLGGNGAARIASAVIRGNTFDRPISLDDGLHEALDVTVSDAVVAVAPAGAAGALTGQRWVVVP